MDASVVKKTQDTLGKVIKKPPLTDKLLGKPPFRFLYDIITEVIKNTGVLKGLFKSDELNSDTVKSWDKDAKILFLQKAIDCVGMLLGESLAARPTKIVAGHEPEKTNAFLQALGKVCIKKMDSSDSVKKVLAGEKPSSGKSRNKEGSGTRSSSKERPKDVPEKRKEPEKKEEKESRKVEDKKRKDSTSASRTKDERERNSAKAKDKEKEKEKTKEKTKEKKKEEGAEAEADKESKDRLDAIANDSTTNDGKNEDDAVGNRSIQRPSSAKGQRRRPANQEGDKENRPPSDEAVADKLDENEAQESEEPTPLVDEASMRQPSTARRAARPSSARPAPPKVKRNAETEDPGPRLGSGKQFNAVIVDNPKDQDDDDDLFVVEENLQNEPYFEETNNDNPIEIEDGQHGSLVKKMLDSKREAEITQAKINQQKQDKPVIIDATKKKEKELAQKEIDKLRNSIQSLCRSALPLGKVMDYLQEDIDSMQKELAMWKKENQQHRLALKAEQSITESEIEPLHAQLGELELEMTDMVDKISSVKSNIIRNNEKIRDLIGGITR